MTVNQECPVRSAWWPIAESSKNLETKARSTLYSVCGGSPIEKYPPSLLPYFRGMGFLLFDNEPSFPMMRGRYILRTVPCKRLGYGTKRQPRSRNHGMIYNTVIADDNRQLPKVLV